MPAPVYPPILTKADWDKNKGTIGKHPNELGIGRAVSDAEASFKQIDWSLWNQPQQNAGSLKILPHPNLTALITRIQTQQQRLNDASDALLKLANVTHAVVQQYERASTFPKPVIEHVRKMKTSAGEFRTYLFTKKLDQMLLMVRKARGLAKLNTIDFDNFMSMPPLTFEFLQREVRKIHSEVEFQFLIETNGAFRGVTCPSGPEADQLYLTYIKPDPISKSNSANIAAEKCKPLENFYEQGSLRNPGAKREEVRAAWAAAYRDGKTMFTETYKKFRRELSIEDASNFLLVDVLQS